MINGFENHSICDYFTTPSSIKTFKTKFQIFASALVLVMVATARGEGFWLQLERAVLFTWQVEGVPKNMKLMPWQLFTEFLGRTQFKHKKVVADYFN